VLSALLQTTSVPPPPSDIPSPETPPDSPTSTELPAVAVPTEASSTAAGRGGAVVTNVVGTVRKATQLLQHQPSRSTVDGVGSGAADEIV
jgi:hypothetical protein